MHVARLPHGTLTPHSVWLGYQGSVRILDAPAARVLRESLPRTPDAKAALTPFLHPSTTNPVLQDLFQIGALFHVLLTGRPLADPRRPELSWVRAQIHTPNGPMDLPPDLHHLLGRLLGVESPFPNLESLLRTLEASLFTPEAPAYTFELAHWMQRHFRERWRQEQIDLEAEKTWDFRWLLAQEARTTGTPTPIPNTGGNARPSVPSKGLRPLQSPA